eukprot:scaffold46777_cov32-Tisochrysis_lutea.AAC.5
MSVSREPMRAAKARDRALPLPLTSYYLHWSTEYGANKCAKVIRQSRSAWTQRERPTEASPDTTHPTILFFAVDSSPPARNRRQRR